MAKSPKDGTDVVDRLKAEKGRMAALAREMGISRSAIGQWKKVPLDRVPEVARILDIPHHLIRPDVFPDPGKSRAA